MRFNELLEKRDDNFGVYSHSPEEIADKHKVKVSMIEEQIVKGIKVELEHTEDEKLAREIALDHLWEIPDYYDRLDKMEQEGKKKWGD